MKLFDEPLGYDETIFKQPGVLDYEYLPRLLPYRENEQKYIADCIKRIPQGGSNVFIVGKPGIGKTASVKYVLRELKSHTEEIFPIYINCWIHDTSLKLVSKLAEDLNISHTTRLQERLLSLIFKRLNLYKGIAIVFDEIDRLEDYNFLYGVIQNISYKSMFFISSDNSWLSHLDERIRSRLNPDILEFKPYNWEEMYGILQERKDYAFFENVWEDRAFEKVVDQAYSAGDVRVGLNLLKRAGQIAEDKLSRKVTIEHVVEAISSQKLKKDKRTLSEF